MMNSDIQRMGHQSVNVPPLGWVGPGDPEVVSGGFHAAVRALRGRYVLGAILALLGGVLGGLVGWRMGKLAYRSEGMVRIAASLPKVVQENALNAPLERYDAFMQSQQMLMMSRRIVEESLLEPEWKATGLGNSEQVVEEFAENLKAEYRSKTELLHVSFTDRDPKLAEAAVRSVINAYARNYNSQDQLDQEKRLSVLKDLLNEQIGQLEDRRDQIRKIAQEFGSAKFNQLYDSTMLRVAKLESTLTDIKIAKALTQGKTNDSAKDFGVGQIAAVDPMMRDYVAEQQRRENDLAQLQLSGFGSAHPEVVRAKRALEAAQARVDSYATEYRRYHNVVMSAAQAQASPADPAALTGQPIETLKADESGIKELLNQTQEEMVERGAKQMQIDTLQAEADKLAKEVEDTTERIEAFVVESKMAGRLSVTSPGEAPLAPLLDNRRLTAAAGAVGGAGLPVALLVVAGIWSRRYRFCDDTESDVARKAPLLGILPTLPEHLDNADQSAEAARCVHQIRVILQVGRDTKKQVYQISSAAAGEGKTSLSMALGLSFAASGVKTLVIDCDLVGRRLSYDLGADKMPGLHDALAHGTLMPYVRMTRTGLAVLPVGDVSALDACRVSGPALRNLVAQARAEFDAVLIDSGPILGSVEATVVAPEVDGVIFTVARGQERLPVEKAMQRLETVGAKVVGFVFNRAQTRDFYHSAHGSSMRTTSVTSNRLPAVRPTGRGFTSLRFGPLVRSVAASIPGMDGEDMLACGEPAVPVARDDLFEQWV